MTPADDDFFAIGHADVLRSRLSELEAECERLQRENKDLRQRLGTQAAELEPVQAGARDSIPTSLALVG